MIGVLTQQQRRYLLFIAAARGLTLIYVTDACALLSRLVYRSPFYCRSRCSSCFWLKLFHPHR